MNSPLFPFVCLFVCLFTARAHFVCLVVCFAAPLGLLIPMMPFCEFLPLFSFINLFVGLFVCLFTAWAHSTARGHALRPQRRGDAPAQQRRRQGRQGQGNQAAATHSRPKPADTFSYWSAVTHFRLRAPSSSTAAKMNARARTINYVRILWL